MNIQCDSCQSKFKIPQEKIPTGKTASFLCPKCKNRITIKPEGAPPAGEAPATSTEGPSLQAQQSDTSQWETMLAEANEEYDADEKPFDFIEEEGKTALICEADPMIRKEINAILDLMEYHITEVENIRDALKKMRYHVYDLILVNEKFNTENPDSNAVLRYLERLNMALRRKIFVILLSDRFRTMDNMMAFNKSVNLIINTKNIDRTENVLKRSLADHEMFYRIYIESQKLLGRI